MSGHADVLDVREADTVMPVVPMFHVNAWGLPFTCAMAGARQVLPGPRLDAASLLAAIAEEGVTVTAGVPTVWLALLAALDAEPGAHDVSTLRCVIVGGSAAPRALMEGLERRHGVPVLHAWGMTEMTPVGTVSRLPPDCAGDSEEERYRVREAQGRPVPFVEIRARGDEGLDPPRRRRTWASWRCAARPSRRSYFGHDGPDDRFTDDGWFRTGDIVTIDERQIVRITDREKDLVKSGGEWISSVALENALMGHPDVAEAAVIAVPDTKWGERPLAVVVPRDGASPTPEELIDHLRPSFASWWLPDAVEFVDAVPRTATGKFKKAELRARFGRPPARLGRGDHRPGEDPPAGDEAREHVGVALGEALGLGRVGAREDERAPGRGIAQRARHRHAPGVDPLGDAGEVGLAVGGAPLEDVLHVVVEEEQVGARHLGPRRSMVTV